MGIFMGMVVSGVAMWGFRSKVGGARGGVTLRTNGGLAGAVKVNLAPSGGGDAMAM